MQVDGTPRRVTAFFRELQTKQSNQIKLVRDPQMKETLKAGEQTKGREGLSKITGH